MEGQIHVDRGPCITTRESYDGPPALGPNRPVPPWQLAIEIQGLLGADSEPDTLFFVESWTLGVTTAVESLKQRRQGQADREPYGHAIPNFNNLRALSFVQEREPDAEFLSSARPAAISRCHDAGRPPRSPAGPAAWTEDPASREWEAGAEEYASSGETTCPMTLGRACEVLGVPATSTRGEIKAAYRHMVSQWHPDRLGSRSEKVRQLATEKTVEINSAYRLLRSAMRQKSI
jgi:hypothetical protein